MLEIPGEQKIDPMDRGDGDVKRIPRFRCRDSLPGDERLGQCIHLGYDCKQIDAADFMQSLARCRRIAAGALIEHQLRNI